MPEFGWLGKALLLIGGLIAAVGGLLLLVARLPGLGDGLGWVGKLPGDILIKREHYTLYFPLATSVVISVILTLILFLVSFLSKR